MTEAILTILANSCSITVILLLLRYVFGAGMNLNLRKLLIIVLVYLGYGAISLCINSESTLISVIVYIVAVYLITCKERRWRIIAYLIPMLLIYNLFSLYLYMYDSLLFDGKQVIYWMGDWLLIAVLLIWGAYVDKKELSFSLNFWECLVLSIWGFVACFYGDVMGMIEKYMTNRNPAFMKLIWIVFVTILNVCLVMVIVLRRRYAYENKIRRYYQQYFSEEYQRFCEKNERQQELDRLRHDWKNHVNTVQAMWERGEATQAVEYVASLAEETRTNLYTILSGNEVADAILNMKYEKAKKAGIEFTFHGNLSGLSRLESMDICVLLGNALDNALEACGKNMQESSIKITATENKSFLLIVIENTLHAPIVFRDGRPVTSKKHPSEHGFGILGMEHVLHKYQGNIKYDIKDAVFKVKIMLPLEENRSIWKVDAER